MKLENVVKELQKLEADAEIVKGGALSLLENQYGWNRMKELFNN